MKALLKNLNGFSCDQILWSLLNDLYSMIRPIGDDVLRNSYTIKPVYKETEEAIESIRIKRVEFRENVRAFFPPGTKQTVRKNGWGVRNAGFDWSAGLYMFKSACSYWALTVIVFLGPKMTHMPTNCELAILMKRPVRKKKEKKTHFSCPSFKGTSK